MQKIEFRAMGCQMLAAVDSHADGIEAVLSRVPEWFDEWEQSLSRFREDSELSRLNRAEGEPVPVSSTLWNVLQAALEAERASGGLVTPAVFDALVHAGYDRTFESLENPHIQPRPEPGVFLDDVTAIRLDDVARTIQLPMGLHLDFGGIAKGWAAAQAAKRLRNFAPALVDAGGDIAINGQLAGSQPWPVGIEDPFHPGSDLDLLMISEGGVATSGKDYRRWKKNGLWQHHIIDPRTQKPAETDVLSVTVIAPALTQAEMAAKRILITGGQAGLAWLETIPSLAALVVTENGKCYHSKRLHSYLWSG